MAGSFKRKQDECSAKVKMLLSIFYVKRVGTVTAFHLKTTKELRRVVVYLCVLLFITADGINNTFRVFIFYKKSSNDPETFLRVFLVTILVTTKET